MALAIEPMITRGGRHVAELDDGWTVVSVDGSRAAHFEHTVAIIAGRAMGADRACGRKVGLADRAGVSLDRRDLSPAATLSLAM